MKIFNNHGVSENLIADCVAPILEDLKEVSAFFYEPDVHISNGGVSATLHLRSKGPVIEDSLLEKIFRVSREHGLRVQVGAWITGGYTGAIGSPVVIFDPIAIF